MSFQVHTVESAPEGSKATLRAIEARYGFLPNLAAAAAESPGALKGLLAAIAAFDDDSLSLSPVERQVVLIAASAENRCEYCIAAHGMLASKLGLGFAQVERLQRQQALADERLEALRDLTTTIVRQRGWLEAADLERFMRAGFDRGQVLEVVLGVALKTLTNYINHIADVEVNEQFAEFLPGENEAA